jgi:hypothetical protein
MKEWQETCKGHDAETLRITSLQPLLFISFIKHSGFSCNSVSTVTQGILSYSFIVFRHHHAILHSLHGFLISSLAGFGLTDELCKKGPSLQLRVLARTGLRLVTALSTVILSWIRVRSLLVLKHGQQVASKGHPLQVLVIWMVPYPRRDSGRRGSNTRGG